ncbi:molecular chaperone HtpG [Shewanella oneidensis MR-1]|uniref:Chaperone protein HtpG n=1 Tax=Shewanella oneidensis (strain ATCC 700550 / JCM 31522 / CIP 106686 / LMG 19005 / NCIMB 14063 / MR-1) TaxID=211586 RepID=HTPG_SHEON|nr:molecular chaperone HtpG [Shewanella oneidensis]Q8EFF7.1 RecName: Full=Chaperone protein HtpG; AltName: Full=Heat shock protein HtpG; AltName: Full=High temperature protein G [Shewanella oneidensis MR-1]AAN55066.1 heat shock chaperone HtpG [Shewanella oneidensis MR-1]MDX5996233.1 molecular chaperone HtpG [Shewanella oneidensis]MEE2029670.1 Chaperone protein HtpG [Shewanella oneidensis]QKG96644.1 molecular chaperone HtpG [Shewanella oneidensis MR-1]
MSQQETHGFQTEVKQLLHLMIHSLYSNKEIFLRELVSNAADAADKLRYLALTNDALYEGDGELRVRISADKEKGTVTIEDNGVGMTRDGVIEHLGTIAKSGTAEFFKNLSGEASKDSQLIGQFGVGFYSAFIVAKKVTVRTRAAGHKANEAVLWESEGEGSFTVETITKATRGTEITLHLRDDEKEFADDWRLRSIITKYSDHISIPVEMWQEGTPERDGPDGEKIPATEGYWKAMNKATALWMRNKSEITDEEYQEFYKHISHDYTDALLWSHNRVEGKQEYTNLLYIPSKAPWDLWNRDRKHGLKLFVQRVFIMDDAEQFMPSYLRFVQGLIDSNDLPLNVSREILQDNHITKAMRTGITKRVLGMLEKLAKDDAEKYQQFWAEFGQVLKEGPAEDFANRERIAGLLRFASTHTGSAAPTVSLDDYISRMKEGQTKIYYIVADSHEAAANSPHLELLRKKGIEVLLMSERIDEWLINHLTEYKEKQLHSVTRGELELGELEDAAEKEAQEKLAEESAPLIERIKAALGASVADVKVTSRLTDTPACVVTGEGEMSTQMIKLMQAAGQPVPEVKPTFEVNPAHPLVSRLNDLQDEAAFADWSNLLLQQAQLSEKGSLADPSAFIKLMNQMLLANLK